MKRWFPLLLATTLASIAVAEVKNPDTFTYLTISDFDSLDPAWAYDAPTQAVILNVYEPLFAFDKGSTEKLVPLAASKVPSRANGLISPDGRTYTIPIRKGVKFHDGAPLTPEDVRYSIIRFMLQDRDAGPSSLLLEPLLGYPATRDDSSKVKPNAYKDAARAVTVQGDNVVIRLPQPFAPILTILTSWAPILSKSWAAKSGDWDGTEATWIKFNNPQKETSPFFMKANGTGPFKFEHWDRKTHEIELTRNEQYWRKPAKLKHIVIRGIDEFATRKLMLTAGDVDVIYAGPQVFHQLSNIPGVQIIDGLVDVDIDPIAFFTFKVKSAGNPFIGSGKLDGEGIPADFFSDKDVRKGFSYAFDYPGYIHDVFRGKAKQATGCIPDMLPGFNPKQEKYTFDLAKAAEHLKKAWNGKVWENGFSMTLVYNTGNTPRQTFCQIMKRQIENLNPKFRIEVRPMDWPAFLDAYKASKLPLFLMGWQADYPDPHNFAFQLLHSKGSFAEPQRYNNPQMDKLVEAAVREVEPDRRKKIYAKIQALEFEDDPHILTVEDARFRAQREWVKGYIFNPVFPEAPYDSYYYTLWKE